MDAERYQYPLALIAMRLEDLNAVHKKYGRLSGDEALRAAAKYLAAQMRETDILVRYSQDEFMVLAPRLNREHALKL